MYLSILVIIIYQPSNGLRETFVEQGNSIQCDSFSVINCSYWSSTVSTLDLLADSFRFRKVSHKQKIVLTYIENDFFMLKIGKKNCPFVLKYSLLKW